MATEYSTPGREPPQRKSSSLPWGLFLVTLLGLAAVLYLGRRLMESERQEAAAARQAAQDVTARLRQVEAESQELSGKVTALELEKSTLSSERDTLSQTLAEREAELAALKATQEEMQDKLKEEIQKGEIILSNQSGRLQVELVDKVLFASGDASLSPRGEEVLGRIGPILAKAQDRIIQVSGHTDDSPPSDKLVVTYPTNWELSVARAVNVTRFLSEKAGVPSKRMVAAGYGEFHPVATNANPQGRARNRRIELLLMPLLDAKKADLAGLKQAAGTATPAKATAPAKVVPAKATAPARRR